MKTNETILKEHGTYIGGVDHIQEWQALDAMKEAQIEILTEFSKRFQASEHVKGVGGMYTFMFEILTELKEELK